MLRVFNYNDQPVTFDQGSDHVMINATQMAKSFGKLPADFIRNDQTKAFIEELERDFNYGNSHIKEKTEILKVESGKYGGTWMHELLALKFAAWLSPKFELWCMKKLRELMTTGQAVISQPEQAIPGLVQYLEHTTAQLKDLESRFQALQEKMPQEDEYYTVMGMASVLGMKLTMAQASGISKMVAQVCVANQWPIDKVYDPRFGFKNCYPREALEKIMLVMGNIGFQPEYLIGIIKKWLEPCEPTDPGAKRFTLPQLLHGIKFRVGREVPTLHPVWVGQVMSAYGFVKGRDTRTKERYYWAIEKK